jgi:hypothetical protein
MIKAALGQLLFFKLLQKKLLAISQQSISYYNFFLPVLEH